MAIGLSTALRTTRMTAILTAIDAGSGPGTITIYSGTRPATGGALGASVQLGVVTFPDPAGSVSGATLTFGTFVADSSADATNTASWARIADSTGAFVADVGVGVSGSGAEIILNTVNIVSGGQISITSGQLTEGNP